MDQLLNFFGLLFLVQLFLGPILETTLLLLVLLILAIYTDRSNGKFKDRPSPFYLLLPFLGPILIILFGAIFEKRFELLFLADVGLGITILLTIITCVLFWRAWVTWLCLIIFIYPLALTARAIAMMSISGTWL